MTYLNDSKLERAKAVINKERNFEGDSVEAKALSICNGEGHKGDALLKCVYVKIGGACIEDAKKAPLEAGLISSKKSGKEKEELPVPGRKARK